MVCLAQCQRVLPLPPSVAWWHPIDLRGHAGLHDGAEDGLGESEELMHVEQS